MGYTLRCPALLQQQTGHLNTTMKETIEMPKIRLVDKITAEQLRLALRYDPKTGLFWWRYRPDMPEQINKTYVGKTAGWLENGYIRIVVNYRAYQAHRLAWLYMTGVWPTNRLDHINGDRSANQWANLRDATASENSQNMSIHKDTISGLKGAHWHGAAQKWMSSIMIAGKSHYLGLFPTAELAHAAYREAAVRLHGKFARFK